jgi:hypothetical protein
MPDSNPFDYIKEAGGVFKFGSGVLGKSAIAIAVLMVGVVVAAWRLHSDAAIIAIIAIGAVVFLVWLLCVLNFAGKHPDVALLEGAEWSGFQRFQAAAKGYIPSRTEQALTIPPGTMAILSRKEEAINPDEESRSNG